MVDNIVAAVRIQPILVGIQQQQQQTTNYTKLKQVSELPVKWTEIVASGKRNKRKREREINRCLEREP